MGRSSKASLHSLSVTFDNVITRVSPQANMSVSVVITERPAGQERALQAATESASSGDCVTSNPSTQRVNDSCLQMNRHLESASEIRQILFGFPRSSRTRSARIVFVSFGRCGQRAIVSDKHKSRTHFSANDRSVQHRSNNGSILLLLRQHCLCSIHLAIELQPDREIHGDFSLCYLGIE